MSDDIEFVDGLIVKAPRDGAPDFVKTSLSIKRVDLMAWLAARNDDWVNVDVKEARVAQRHADTVSAGRSPARGRQGWSTERISWTG